MKSISIRLTIIVSIALIFGSLSWAQEKKITSDTPTEKPPEEATQPKLSDELIADAPQKEPTPTDPSSEEKEASSKDEESSPKETLSTKQKDLSNSSKSSTETSASPPNAEPTLPTKNTPTDIPDEQALPPVNVELELSNTPDNSPLEMLEDEGDAEPFATEDQEMMDAPEKTEESLSENKDEMDILLIEKQESTDTSNAENSTPTTTETFSPNSSKSENVTAPTTIESTLLSKDHSTTESEKSQKDFNVKITEISIGNPDSTKNDYIIITNFGDENVPLKNWRLRKRTNSGNESSIYSSFKDEDVIAAEKSFIWSHKDADGISGTDVTSSSTIAANTSVALIAPDDTVTTSVAWGDDLIDPFNPSDLRNPSACEIIKYNPSQKEYALALNNHDDCKPISYGGEKVLINELFPHPQDAATQDEFIELYNPNDFTVNLEKWFVTDASTTGKYIFDSLEVSARDYITISKNQLKFALNNSGTETISLFAPDNTVVDYISYTDTKEGFSYARKNTSWEWTPVYTPGKKNVFLTDNTYPSLMINEILPNPAGDESAREYIEIYNPTASSVSLKYWQLTDSSATGTYTFMEDIIISPFAYFTIYRSDFDFALNNSGGETISLIAPNTTVTSTVTYQTAKEAISYGWTGSRWRWSKTQTPQKENVFGAELLIEKIDIDDAYKNVYTDFSVDVSHINESTKYRWDFGNGRKSYLRETRHKYLENGTYHGSVRVSNDIEEVTENFTVTVKNYPKYNVRITEIAPNPTGKDYENEYIVIENKDDEKIDFTGWSVATGKDDDHLVNHPFRKKLKLKEGDDKKIRSKYSAISLPNKGGVIELRAPDGKVIHRKEYSYNNGASIPADSVYKKADKEWMWIVPPQKSKKQKRNYLSAYERNAIISQALLNDIAQQQVTNALSKVDKKSSAPKIHTRSLPEKLLQKINTLLLLPFSQNTQDRILNMKATSLSYLK